MKADGFTEKQRTASIDVAVEQLNQKKMHVGKLVDHGAAPYKHDPKNNSSYYATIENSKGEKKYNLGEGSGTYFERTKYH